jgi:hypothetical protein
MQVEKTCIVRRRQKPERILKSIRRAGQALRRNRSETGAKEWGAPLRVRDFF